MVRSPEFHGGRWLGDPLTLQALRGEVVLLDFFTYGCVNCMNNVRMLRRLAERYGRHLHIIGVHGGKFTHEKESAAVENAMRRLGIEWPVYLDSDRVMFDAYAVKAWPTMVLIDRRGYIVAEFRGEGQGVALELALKKLGIGPESASSAESVPRRERLEFPEKLILTPEALFIANTGAGTVWHCSRTGALLEVFEGFGSPSALAAEGNSLFVADRERGEVVRCDLKTGQRQVLLSQQRSLSAIVLSSRYLYVAEAGGHQLSCYGRGTMELLWRFGNRFEALRDGDAATAQLAQPSGMALCDDGRLWFVDAESSALRFIEGKRVQTVVGEGLFTFGDSDEAPLLLQHPQDVACGRIGDGCGGGRLFIADTYNGKIKAYDPQSGRMMTLLSGLDEPMGIAKDGCGLYIAETNAQRIIRFDLPSMRSEVLL